VQLLFGGKSEKVRYTGGIPWEGIPMDTEEREKLITEAVAEFEAGLRAKAEKFQAIHAERKLNISVIETLWGESRKLADEILKRVYTEMTNSSEEKELIQEKKPRSVDQG
jgi:hypothetical protein